MIYAFRALLLICLTAITWLALTSEPLPVGYQAWDKPNHWVAFFTLAFLADYSFPGSRRDWIKWIILAAYGLGLEVMQLLTGFRAFEFDDLLADILGIGCYLPLRGLIQRIPFLSLNPGSNDTSGGDPGQSP